MECCLLRFYNKQPRIIILKGGALDSVKEILCVLTTVFVLCAEFKAKSET